MKNALQRRGFSSLALIALLGLLLGQSARAATFTGRDLFEEIIYVLAREYHGTSAVKVGDLHRKYLPKVKKICADASKCTPEAVWDTMNLLVEDMGDKHISLYSPAEQDQSDSEWSEGTVDESYGFVGRYVKGRGMLVTEVHPQSPAANAGLRSGDVIASANGELIGSNSDIARLIDKPESRGEDVEIELERHGGKIGPVRLAVGTHKVPVIAHRWLEEGVAYVQLRHFDEEHVGQRFHNTIRRLQQEGMRGMVLDLRNNSGGSLNELFGVSSALTRPQHLREHARHGTLLWTEEGGELKINGITTATVRKPQRFAGPLVVLVNEDSASAAEYLSRDLKLRPRTLLLGRETYGIADTSIMMHELGNGAGLHLTVGHMHNAEDAPMPPSVTPHRELRLDDEAFARTGLDPEIEAARRALTELQ